MLKSPMKMLNLVVDEVRISFILADSWCTAILLNPDYGNMWKNHCFHNHYFNAIHIKALWISRQA